MCFLQRMTAPQARYYNKDHTLKQCCYTAFAATLVGLIAFLVRVQSRERSGLATARTTDETFAQGSVVVPLGSRDVRHTSAPFSAWIHKLAVVYKQACPSLDFWLSFVLPEVFQPRHPRAMESLIRGRILQQRQIGAEPTSRPHVKAGTAS